MVRASYGTFGPAIFGINDSEENLAISKKKSNNKMNNKNRNKNFGKKNISKDILVIMMTISM